MLSAAQMLDFFNAIDDPRTRKGRRHSLPSILAATAATVRAADWGMGRGLGHKALERFGVRRRNGARKPPCRSTIRTVLIRVDPDKPRAATLAPATRWG